MALTRVTFSTTGGILPCNIFLVSAASVAVTPSPTVNSILGVIIADQSVTFADSGNTMTITGSVYAQVAAVTFAGIAAVNGCSPYAPGPYPPPFPVICYAKGTQISTPRGPVPIEDIKVGDKVIVKGPILGKTFYDSRTDLNTKQVIWTSKFSVHTHSKLSCPIRIKKDALGPSVPFEDLYVSPAHGIAVGDKIVEASSLLNDESITQEYDQDEVTYYHVEVPGHVCLLANGVIAESYLDANTRDVFDKSVRLMPKRLGGSSWYAKSTF